MLVYPDDDVAALCESFKALFHAVEEVKARVERLS